MILDHALLYDFRSKLREDRGIGGAKNIRCMWVEKTENCNKPARSVEYRDENIKKGFFDNSE